MKGFKINIFGNKWTVTVGRHAEVPNMCKDSAGETDFTSKEITIEDLSGTEGPGRWKYMNVGMKETLRHEIVHAALIECGLSTNRRFDHEQVADWLMVKHYELHAIIVDAESKFDKAMKTLQPEPKRQ